MFFFPCQYHFFILFQITANYNYKYNILKNHLNKRQQSQIGGDIILTKNWGVESIDLSLKLSNSKKDNMCQQKKKTLHNKYD